MIDDAYLNPPWLRLRDAKIESNRAAGRKHGDALNHGPCAIPKGLSPDAANAIRDREAPRSVEPAQPTSGGPQWLLDARKAHLDALARKEVEP
jgi:hypothetical protein